jgi:hypothetical protein
MKTICLYRLLSLIQIHHANNETASDMIVIFSLFRFKLQFHYV